MKLPDIPSCNVMLCSVTYNAHISVLSLLHRNARRRLREYSRRGRRYLDTFLDCAAHTHIHMYKLTGLGSKYR